MAANNVAKKLPLVVIVGPTASGKTSVAIQLAEKLGGEIICADSRSIYRHMDIGTAKPTIEERQRVPHWGLDLVDPGDYFTVSDFKTYALAKIDEIRGRGHVPFLVGGTGLYVDAIIFDYQFGGTADFEWRQRLEQYTVEELQKYCENHNVKLPENAKNKRYLVRAIERKNISAKRRRTPVSDTIIVGITTDKAVLRERIQKRAEQIFDSGVVEEAIILGKKYGWNSEAMTGNIYPLVHAYLEKQITLEEMKERSATLDWRLAKRQLTWLKRNTFIHWLSLDEVEAFVIRSLASE